MQVDVAKFISDIVRNQAKVIHFEPNVQVGKPAKLKSSLKSKIYGELGSDSFASVKLVAVAKVEYGQETALSEWTRKFTDLLSSALNSDVRSDEVETVELGDEEACLVVKISF